MKKLLIGLAFAASIYAIDALGAAALKAWRTTDTPTANDVNNNFDKLHAHMRGVSHGLVRDIDVSSAAQLDLRKLAAWSRVPRLMGRTFGLCSTNGPCAMMYSIGVASDGGYPDGAFVSGVNRTAAGTYQITASAGIDPASVLVNSDDDGGWTNRSYCDFNVSGPTNSRVITVFCYDEGLDALADRPFSFASWSW